MKNKYRLISLSIFYLFISSTTSQPQEFPAKPPLIKYAGQECHYELQVNDEKKIGIITIRQWDKKKKETVTLDIFSSADREVVILSQQRGMESGFQDLVFADQNRSTGTEQLKVYYANQSFLELISLAHFKIKIQPPANSPQPA